MTYGICTVCQIRLHPVSRDQRPGMTPAWVSPAPFRAHAKIVLLAIAVTFQRTQSPRIKRVDVGAVHLRLAGFRCRKVRLCERCWLLLNMGTAMRDPFPDPSSSWRSTPLSLYASTNGAALQAFEVAFYKLIVAVSRFPYRSYLKCPLRMSEPCHSGFNIFVDGTSSNRNVYDGMQRHKLDMSRASLQIPCVQDHYLRVCQVAYKITASHDPALTPAETPSSRSP